MLVSRHFDTDQSHWSSKFEAAFHKSNNPRMSSYDSPLSTQPDWQGNYSFIPPGESSIFGSSFEQVSSTGNDNDTVSQPRSTSTHNNNPESRQNSTGEWNSPLSRRHTLDPLGLRQSKAESEARRPSDVSEPNYTIKSEIDHEEPLRSPAPVSATLEPPSSSGGPQSEQSQIVGLGTEGTGDVTLAKDEEDEEVVEDEDMLEGDGDGEGEVEDETSAQPQTAAERTAARRKMKRFRLTHQQTRFLMSEFAKQPHPDAAHRERLSREIPGLSPRQVQVWFQNRRAKIKRMTADDRDRMIKMRAVPDDFDNVQALHSPYGAVHALGTPVNPPVEFGSPSYTDHIMRPLMLDTMRRDNDDHVSPTGLSPAFGNVGFSHSGTMSNSDILSPLSPSSTDRGFYSSHLTSPLAGSARSSNPFARQSSLDAGMQLHSQSRQSIRPLQPLSLRETMSRSRSDNLQSPLRSSMSWKGDAIDYSTYSGGSGSPGASRHASVYQPEHIGGSSTSTLGYDSGSFSRTGLQPSSTNINYSSLQQPSQSRSRLRAASATLPLGLDLRHQYRSVSTGHGLQPPSHSSTGRAGSIASYGTSSGYSTSFPSAPLTAPIDFSLPRTPGIRNAVHDYSIPQMSAPIAPPHDFTQALHGNIGASTTRTPIRDTFGGGPLSLSQSQGSNDKNDDFTQDGLSGSSIGLKRKRSSFSLSSSQVSGPQSSQPYGYTS
ncbi:hypothetical protein F5Y18DRAFT_151146 [Xylariaceae sp. FL1019]|nr:hypothetical protein F5Y18DRAFT_151146 [Xylariaceae sp. FL1019]